MSKDQNNVNQSDLEKNQYPEGTFDLDAQTSQDRNEGEPMSGNNSVGVNTMSIERSDLDQTMDLTPSDQSIDSGTMDVSQAEDHTMDLDSQHPKLFDGTRMISPSMRPFEGKVFGNEDSIGAGGETRFLGPEHNESGQTMDLNQNTSGSTGDSVSNPSGTPDATMLLSDSQSGSQAGSQPSSSSMTGKSSYSQTMDLSDSASDSKGVVDSSSVSAPNKTGQSVPATGKSGFKSMADSRQYLKADRAKASDAFLDRVTERKISYALDWNDVSADYQVNKKVDPKTGKLELHVLGKGGMGLVYMATQNSVNRPVALKVIRKDKQTEAFSKQFFYEAEITATLEHPNITPIYELGRSPDGTFFYSMKYIQGIPWEKKIRDNSIEENLEIFDKLCDAIGFAHSKNIVHMDIKPDNVQLGEYGEVYAVDWGVANNLKRTESIRCAGTWQWISPEVSRGERDKIGKGSDIYLLGGVLFLIVTGHHPRLPKDPAIKMGQAGLTKAAQGNIIQPTDCKDPMVAVALKALSTEPKDRFARVEDLQEAIHKIQKQRANIKSSQELTVRSMVIGAQAQERGDYDQFNRAVFGLRDAIELWDQNPDAPGELKKVRLAYGQCAFDKGDYDLALQTLDRSQASEDELYRKAEDAQTAVKLRSKRFRLLRNAFIALLTLGTGVVGWFWYQAEQQKFAAVSAKVEADDQKYLAEQARDDANDERKKAERARDDSIKAKKDADLQREIAVSNATKARTAEGIALTAKAQAEEQLAKTQLTEIASRLGLARSRLLEANPNGAQEMLSDIQANINDQSNTKSNTLSAIEASDTYVPPTKLLITDLPSSENWAQRRLELLANSKLAGTDLTSLVGIKSGPPALAIDPDDDAIIVVYPDGNIYRSSFDGNQPEHLLDSKRAAELGWPNDISISRVVPATQENRIYLAIKGAKAPILTVNLETKQLIPFDRDVKKAGQILTLSPVSRHIATTQPGYIWFTKNTPDSHGNAVPTKDRTIQMKWLTDDLLLALIENKGSYHLKLIAPFLGSFEASDEEGIKKIRPSFLQYTATLEEDVVQFGLIDSELPEIITKFDPLSLGKLDEQLNGELKSEQVQSLFCRMIESLHFVVGQSDGNLVQTQLKKSGAISTLGLDYLTRINQYALPRYHLHKIEEIVVESHLAPGFTSRRVLTRAQKEQAVQVWAIPQADSGSVATDNLGVSHLHALSGGAFKDEQSDDKKIVFSALRKDGKVILVNSEWNAFLLDVQEQMDRKRIALEVPFEAASFLESTAKWLFKHGSEGQVLSVDGYGGVALYDSAKQGVLGTGKRLALGPQQSQLQLRFWPELTDTKNDQAQKGVHPLTNFQYWGHSPFAKIQHFALSPDLKRAISLADIPGNYAGYLIPRDRSARTQALEFKEICLWDLANNQMLDRIIFDSKDSIDRLSILDDQRIVVGNAKTFSFIDIDPSDRSIIQGDMKDTAVQFCAPNPKHPYHAFFRSDNDGAGTCWIGRIPTEKSPKDSSRKWFSPDENCMTLDQGLSIEIPKGAPVAGCWSGDGLRLYVLDKSYQIHKFQLDINTGTLSKTFGSGSRDVLKPDSEASTILSQLTKNPERISIGLVHSSSSPEGWSDTLFFDSIDLPETSKVIHATFSSDSKAQWSLQVEASDSQKIFRASVLKFMNLAKTNLNDSTEEIKTQDRHQPLHATTDSSGDLLLMHYPSALLFLSLEDPINARWYRLEQVFDDLKSFDLSPDKSTLACVDADGLHLFRVLPNENNRDYSLVPTEIGLPTSASVAHFEWDKDSLSQQNNRELKFAYILKDGTVGHFHSGGNQVLGKLSEIKPSHIADSNTKKSHELTVSEIIDLWFFKEVLIDETDTDKPRRMLRYLAVQYLDESTKDKKVRFIQLGGLSPDRIIQYIDLNIGRNYTKVVPNEQGGVIVTGDNQGNVVVHLVSPFWGIANQVFDATSEADSPIECLSFIDDQNDQDNMLIISNGNNHIFGLKTEISLQQSN